MPASRPILFSAPMVRALLAGTKTQTRRVINPQPTDEALGLIGHARMCGHFGAHVFGRCMASMVPSPYGKPGDRLWVRETFYCDDHTYGDLERARVGYVSKPPTDDEIRARWLESIEYRADHDCSNWEAGCPCSDDDGHSSWRPSIFMPRWASRIELEVTEIRVQRLHEIDELDALAEGVEGREVDGVLDGNPGKYIVGMARDAYAALWDEINGAGSWAANPWVWCVTFKRTEVP